MLIKFEITMLKHIYKYLGFISFCWKRIRLKPKVALIVKKHYLQEDNCVHENSKKKRES